MRSDQAIDLQKYLVKQGVAGITLLAFLLTQLAWPFPAFALRVQAGLESTSESDLKAALLQNTLAGLEEGAVDALVRKMFSKGGRVALKLWVVMDEFGEPQIDSGASSIQMMEGPYQLILHPHTKHSEVHYLSVIFQKFDSSGHKVQLNEAEKDRIAASLKFRVILPLGFEIGPGVDELKSEWASPMTQFIAPISEDPIAFVPIPMMFLPRGTRSVRISEDLFVEIEPLATGLEETGVAVLEKQPEVSAEKPQAIIQKFLESTRQAMEPGNVLLIGPKALEGSGGVPALWPLLIQAAPHLTPAEQETIVIYTENSELLAFLKEKRIGYRIYSRFSDVQAWLPTTGVTLYTTEEEWLLRGQLSQVTDTILLTPQTFPYALAHLLTLLGYIPPGPEKLKELAVGLEESA